MTVETFVRPFIGKDTSPVRVVKAGQAGVEPVLVMVGRKGGARTFAWSGNSQLTAYLIRVHRERGDVADILNQTGG